MSLYQKNYSMLLESHSTLSTISSAMAWPVTRYLTIPLHSDNYMQARLLLPPDLDTKQRMKYPLVLNM